MFNRELQATMLYPVPKERPKESDPWVLKRTAAELAERLMKEFPDDFPDEEGAREEIADQILDCLTNDDGYKIARDLEQRFYWDANMGIAEVLDAAFSIRCSLTAEAVRVWVEACRHRLVLPIGTSVSVPYYDLKSYRRVMVEGEICKHFSDRYVYGVFCPSLGHVREQDLYMPDGRPSGKTGTLHLNINAEDVTPLNQQEQTLPGASNA